MQSKLFREARYSLSACQRQSCGRPLPSVCPGASPQMESREHLHMPILVPFRHSQASLPLRQCFT